MVIFDTRKMADTSDTLNSSACTGGASSETCWAIPMPYSIPTAMINFQCKLDKKYTQSLNGRQLAHAEAGAVTLRTPPRYPQS
jgi:hypothetical protein